MTETFWKPEPKQPWHDWRTYSMLLPVLSGTVGACIFMALGFSFTEMGSIAQGVRTPMVIVASFAVAIGSTFGSIGSGIEVFRKRFKKEAEGWDWISLGISTLTTVAGFGMGFAALLGGTTDWSKAALIWGSVIVGTLAALDSLGDLIELGGLMGSYELRLNEYEQWRVSTGQNLKPIGQDLEERLANLEERYTWLTATAADVKRATSHLNGDRANLTRQELGLILAEHQLNLPSPATVRRGLQ